MASYARLDRFEGHAPSTLRARAPAAGQAAHEQPLSAALRYVVYAVLLTRSAGDPVFEALGGAGEAVGIGGLINALVIAVAAILVISQSSSSPFAIFGMWTPFLLAAFGAVFYAPQFMPAFRTFLVILTYWALFVMPFFLFRSRADLSRFVLLIFASSLGPSLYAVLGIAHGWSDWADFRLQSTFQHPNIFAFYLVLLLGLALYVRASHAVRWPPVFRRLVTLYIPVLLVFLVLTKTRSAWAACLAMFLVHALWFDRRFLLGFLAAPLLFVVDPALSDRLMDLLHGDNIENLKSLNEEIKLNSLAWRELLWSSALPLIAERPILGHGLESFKSYSLEFFPLALPAGGTDAHNFFLQTLFEMGLLGILALLWLLGSVGWRIKGGLRYDRDGIVVILSLTLLVGYLLESYADNMLYYLSFNWYFWFAMGAICAWVDYEKAARRRTLTRRPRT